MTAFCRGYLIFELRFISPCPNKAGRIVSEPGHLSLFTGGVLWIVASAEGEHLKALSRAGSDSEIGGGRSLSYSQFFPHTRIERNPFFKEKLEVPSTSLSGRYLVTHMFSCPGALPFQNFRYFFPFVQPCPEMLCQWNFPFYAVLQVWIVLLHRMVNNALMKFSV